MIQQTSLIAYQDIKPELNRRQKTVYLIIKHFQPITNLSISNLLKLPINSITPRVKELRDKELVIEKDTIISNTGRRAIRWVLK